MSAYKMIPVTMAKMIAKMMPETMPKSKMARACGEPGFNTRRTELEAANG